MTTTRPGTAWRPNTNRHRLPRTLVPVSPGAMDACVREDGLHPWPQRNTTRRRLRVKTAISAPARSHIPDRTSPIAHRMSPIDNP